MTTAAAPIFTLRNPMVLFGIFMFLINRFTDQNFRLPVADLLFPFLTLYFAARDKNLSNVLNTKGFILLILLLLWMTASNLVNGISLAGQARNTFAVTTLFLPLLFFIAMKDRDAVMGYLIGSIIGFVIYFASLVGQAGVTGEIPRTLRGDQLTPTVPLALYFLFREKLSRNAGWLLLLGAGLSIFISFAIDVRAPLVALIAAAGLLIASRATPWPRLAQTGIVIMCLLAHFAASLFNGSNFDAVVQSNNDTISNMERAYAIDYTRAVLDRSPWFGESPQGFSDNFTDNFMAIAGLQQQADTVASPHNTFLEYSVFFGYPAAIFIMMLMAQLIFTGMRNATFARSLFMAFACASIIRLGAFYGFSGWLRIEWFAISFAMYYAYGVMVQEPETPAEPAPEAPKSKTVKLSSAGRLRAKRA